MVTDKQEAMQGMAAGSQAGSDHYTFLGGLAVGVGRTCLQNIQFATPKITVMLDITLAGSIEALWYGCLSGISALLVKMAWDKAKVKLK